MESLQIILRTNDALEKFGREEKEEMASRKNRFYVEWVQKITSEDVLPGIRSLLRELKSREIKTAVASSSHNVFTVIDRVALKKANLVLRRTEDLTLPAIERLFTH